MRLGEMVTTLNEVRCYKCFIPYGSIGEVVGFGFTGNPLVEFTHHIGGHGGVNNLEGKNGHCWYIWPGNLISIEAADGN